jgi:hypothetical protein
MRNFEEILLDVQQAYAKTGYKPRRGQFVDSNGCCCPIYAFHKYKDYSLNVSYNYSLAQLLGISQCCDNISGYFLMGFDGVNYRPLIEGSEEQAYAYKIGRKLADVII